MQELLAYFNTPNKLLTYWDTMSGQKTREGSQARCDHTMGDGNFDTKPAISLHTYVTFSLTSGPQPSIQVMSSP